MKLTKREKILLFLLLFVGVIGLSTVYLFIPKFEGITARRATISELQMELADRQIAAAQVQRTKEELDLARQEGEQLYSAAAAGKNYEVSLLLSELMGRHGVTPLRLSIADVALEDEAEQALYYTLRDITLSFAGERANAMAFVDELSGYDTALVLYAVAIEQARGGVEYTVRLWLYEFAAPAAVEGEGA